MIWWIKGKNYSFEVFSIVMTFVSFVLILSKRPLVKRFSLFNTGSEYCPELTRLANDAAQYLNGTKFNVACLSFWNVNSTDFCAEAALLDETGTSVGVECPEKDFFSKLLDFHGIPIKAHQVVSDEAMYAAYDRLALLFTNLLPKQPMVITNLVAAGA